MWLLNPLEAAWEFSFGSAHPLAFAAHPRDRPGGEDVRLWRVRDMALPRCWRTRVCVAFGVTQCLVEASPGLMIPSAAAKHKQSCKM